MSRVWTTADVEELTALIHAVGVHVQVAAANLLSLDYDRAREEMRRAAERLRDE